MFFFSNYIYSPIKDIRDSIGVGAGKDGNQDELELIGNAFSSYRRREDCYRWDTSPVRKAVRKCFKRQDSSWEELENFPIPFWRQWPLVSPYCVVVLSADSSCRQNDFLPGSPALLLYPDEKWRRNCWRRVESSRWGCRFLNRRRWNSR